MHQAQAPPQSSPQPKARFGGRGRRQMNSSQIRPRILLWVSGVLLAAGLMFAGSAAAAAPVPVPYLEIPDTVKPGALVKIFSVIENGGDAPMSGDLTLEESFPVGITPVAQPEDVV